MTARAAVTSRRPIPAQRLADHAGRVRGDIGYALLGTSVWARAEPTDVELGDAEQLVAAYPSARAAIAGFML